MLMPSDMSVWQRMDQAFRKRARWDLKFAWLPRRCMFSNKIIWLERAYQGVGIWTGPGDSIIETRWAKDFEYLIWRLKH